MGLAGVAQVVRIHCHSQLVRQGQVIKDSNEVRFAVTTYWPEQAGPERLLQVGRDHWSIENGQYYRRDRTQDEDRFRYGTPLRPATSPCFGLWPFFGSSSKPRLKRVRNPCPTSNAMFIASLGD
jgi:hypothetical protein